MPITITMREQDEMVRAAEMRGAMWALEAKLDSLPLYTPIELANDAERIVDRARGAMQKGDQ